MSKIIRVKDSTYNNLAKLGDLQDSFDSVITRLIHISRDATIVASAQENSEK